MIKSERLLLSLIRNMPERKKTTYIDIAYGEMRITWKDKIFRLSTNAALIEEVQGGVLATTEDSRKLTKTIYGKEE